MTARSLRATAAVAAAGLLLFTWHAPAVPAQSPARFAVPPGESAGLVPPAGLSLDYACGCFQSADGVSITVAGTSATTYAQFDSGFADYWKRKGMVEAARAPLTIGGRRAFLVTGDVVTDGKARRIVVLVVDGSKQVVTITAEVPADRRDADHDRTIIEALRTTVVFEPGQRTNRRDAVPFVVGDEAGFRFSHAIPGYGSQYMDGQPNPVTSDWADIWIGTVPTPESPLAPRTISTARLLPDPLPAGWRREGDTVHFDAGSIAWSVRHASGHAAAPIYRRVPRERRAEFVGRHPRGVVHVDARYLDANADEMGPRVERLVRSLTIP